ncbi:MAG: hypothetical protein ACOCVA_01965 [Prolixibacteraceae bacterium]
MISREDGAGKLMLKYENAAIRLSFTSLYYAPGFGKYNQSLDGLTFDIEYEEQQMELH